jgi:hypothetical protein
MKLKSDIIQSLQDARFCSAEGFSALTFNFIKGDINRMGADMIGEISGWLSGTDCILSCGPEILEPGAIPDDLKFQGVQSTDLKIVQEFSNQNKIGIWVQDKMPVQFPQSIFVQLPIGQYHAAAKNDRIWYSLDDVSEINLLDPDNLPYGICFSEKFKDFEGLLDFDRIHDVLDKLDQLQVVRE